ncbi:MAG: alpha-amylase [Bacteroidota bacterium]
MSNQTLMQYFHWYLPNDGQLWNKVVQYAEELAENGITALWLPPSYKGAYGSGDVGYGVYDMYDLGEFDQKGSIRTKYGTKDEYLLAVNIAQQKGLKIYADVVFNHRGGGDDTEFVKAVRVNWDNRQFTYGGDVWIEAYTDFHFPGRAGKYSPFKWNYRHFDGVDWAANLEENSIFKFIGRGKDWEGMVSDENGNYDYLMFSDIDMSHPEVRTELARWGRWYVGFTGVDGFRLDAVKHIQYSFFREWLQYMRKRVKADLFAVGEYWEYDVAKLHTYITHTHGLMHLFDAPLHHNFYQASKEGGSFDMRKILDNSLLQQQPALAVTIVENHDTQPLQALESPVEHWFKPLAYALILMWQDGIPCVFYPDYYGADYRDKGKDGGTYDIVIEPTTHLRELIRARKDYAYGPQHAYLDHWDVIGFTREGLEEVPDSGCAVLMSNGHAGNKWMYMGRRNAGKTYVDLLGNHSGKVKIDGNGFGEFRCQAGSVSVWVKK